MTLWILLTVLSATAAAALAVPLVRRYDARAAASPATQVYRDQLAEIDGQERSGSVSAAEADALRTEAKRRLLAEDRAAERAPRPLGSAALGRVAIGVAAVTALGSTLLYSRLGSPELAQISAPPTPPVGAAPAPAQPGADGQTQASIEGMVAKLEARLKTNPEDADGWRMLGLSRYTLNQFPQAAEAYAQAVLRQPQNAELQSAYGEALVLAAKGEVTPQAKAAFQAAVARDKADPRARYFLGLARDQAGDRPGAIGDWIAIVNDAAPGAPYVPGLVQVIEAAAKQAKLDIAGRIKLAAAPPGGAAPVTVAPAPLASGAGAQQATVSPGLTAAGALPNPSPEQIAAAQAMPPAAQQAMIRGMVDRLAARLKSNPQDPEGWLRLIRARMVLGDAPAAAQARRDALSALTDPGARRSVEEGARSLGVPGA